jgi:hypothetical protein
MDGWTDGRTDVVVEIIEEWNVEEELTDREDWEKFTACREGNHS